MAKVFLLNPPGKVIRTGRLVRESKISTQSWPPIFLAYATGVLEKLGHECVLYDASVLGTSPDSTYKLIEEWNPEVVAYYWAYDTRVEDLAYAERLAKKFRTILVGPWSAHYPEALKDCPSVESMTWGQFEYTLPELIEKRSAKGVTYRDGRYIPQGEPYTRTDLDWMPFVTSVYKKHLRIEAYHQTSFRHPFVDLFYGHGSCPHRCGFCSWVNGMYQLHPNRTQTRSLSKLMEELWYVKRELPQVNQVFFQDSTLITPWAKEISQRILDEGLDICWGCYSRADKDYETLKLMKDAGCRTLHVGYEVPIQSILDEIRKDITVEQEEQFIRDVNRVGLWTSSSFMISLDDARSDKVHGQVDQGQQRHEDKRCPAPGVPERPDHGRYRLVQRHRQAPDDVQRDGAVGAVLLQGVLPQEPEVLGERHNQPEGMEERAEGCRWDAGVPVEMTWWRACRTRITQVFLGWK